MSENKGNVSNTLLYMALLGCIVLALAYVVKKMET
jgi:flagellar biogenesis protein FliO